MVKTKSTTRLAEIFKRYNTDLRNTEQHVTHKAYGFTTVISSEAFQIMEAALKAVYISNQVYNKTHDLRRFLGTMVYHQNELFDPNDIETPYICDSWGDDKGKQATADYHHLCNLLGGMSGKDSESGEDRNLYYALVD